MLPPDEINLCFGKKSRNPKENFLAKIFNRQKVINIREKGHQLEHNFWIRLGKSKNVNIGLRKKVKPS
jgi:hypothetical protein